MKIQYGEVVTGDLEERTITIVVEPDTDFELQAGRVAIVPFDNRVVSVNTQDITDFLKDYMQLRKRQQEYFKKRSKPALIFCKEHEPALDKRAQQLYQELTQPKLL